MSVAFRRESDEEHREPRPELPIPPGPNLVTEAGRRQIEARAAALEADLAAAEADGPPDERVQAIRRDLRYWHTRRATARLAPLPDGEEVAFGTTVMLRRGKAVRTLALVGDDEADPAADRISWSAPIARAILGLAPGETMRFGGEPVEIIAIEPL